MTTDGKVKTDYEKAHAYATRTEKKAPDSWDRDDNGVCGQYWWGLLEGYRAGLRRGRIEARKEGESQ